jgi:hypothetical protein
MAFWLWFVCILVCVVEGARNFYHFWALIAKMREGLVDPFDIRGMRRHAVLRTLSFTGLCVIGAVVAQRIGGVAPIVAIAVLLLWGWRSANSARAAYLDMYLLVMSSGREE